MISDGIVLEAACTTCGSPIKKRYAQRCMNEVLSWSASYRCSTCGRAVEVDGGEELPDDFRHALLAETGTWRLFLIDVGIQKVDLVRALSRALHITPKAALDRVNGDPPHLAEGTHVEMRCLETRLAITSAHLRVTRV